MANETIRFVDGLAEVELPGVGLVKRGQAVTVDSKLAKELLARGGWERVKGGKAAGGE